MRTKSQYKIHDLEQIGLSAVKRDKASESEAAKVLPELSKASSRFGDIIVELEESDAFLQRWSIINTEIERQLESKIE